MYVRLNVPVIYYIESTSYPIAKEQVYITYGRVTRQEITASFWIEDGLRNKDIPLRQVS